MPHKNRSRLRMVGHHLGVAFTEHLRSISQLPTYCLNLVTERQVSTQNCYAGQLPLASKSREKRKRGSLAKTTDNDPFGWSSCIHFSGNDAIDLPRRRQKSWLILVSIDLIQ